MYKYGHFFVRERQTTHAAGMDIRDSDRRRLMKCNGLNIFSFTKNCCCSLCLRIAPLDRGSPELTVLSMVVWWPAHARVHGGAMCVTMPSSYRHRNIPTSLASIITVDWKLSNSSDLSLHTLKLVVENIFLVR